jgi:hypothetical protein
MTIVLNKHDLNRRNRSNIVLNLLVEISFSPRRIIMRKQRYFYSDTVVMPSAGHAMLIEESRLRGVLEPDMLTPMAQPRELIGDDCHTGIRFLKAEHPDNVWHEFIQGMGRANSPKHVKNADGISVTMYAPDGYEGQIK